MLPNFTSENFAFAFWYDQVMARNYFHMVESNWHTASSLDELVDSLGKPLLIDQEQWGTTYIFESNNALIRIYFSTGDQRIYAYVATPLYDADHAKEIINQIREKIKVFVAEDKGITVTFWSLGPHGPETIKRSLEVHTWDESWFNYSTETRTQIEQLLDRNLNTEDGKLILWHGEPGTGKTHAIRALGCEWKNKAELHYILDPEQFLTAHAAYMIRVLLGESGVPSDIGGKPKVQPWKVLIMEDSGEFLARDSKQSQGQGLSRLLNVCDGLIGQGLKILVLITTNEDLGTFHEAVTRPGRCLAKTEFTPLDREAIDVWQQKTGRTYPHSAPATVADLYVGSEQIGNVPKSFVGFKRG